MKYLFRANKNQVQTHSLLEGCHGIKVEREEPSSTIFSGTRERLEELMTWVRGNGDKKLAGHLEVVLQLGPVDTDLDAMPFDPRTEGEACPECLHPSSHFRECSRFN